MSELKVGVMTVGFRMEPEAGIRKAAELGADGVQLNAGRGPLGPDNMDAKKRQWVKDLLDETGLTLAALCGNTGGGYHDPERCREAVDLTKRVLDLAVDLGTSAVSNHIGVVPENAEDQAYQTLRSSLAEVAEHGASIGVVFAVETGPEPAVRLKGLLDDIGSKGIGVNLDPANLVMVANDDPVQAVYTLKDYIVHTHAKDGVQTAPFDPADLYERGKMPEGGWPFKEVPLGEGSVDWDAYLKAFQEIGYNGFLTIEREVGDDPGADIAKAIGFLREKIAGLES